MPGILLGSKVTQVLTLPPAIQGGQVGPRQTQSEWPALVDEAPTAVLLVLHHPPGSHFPLHLGMREV